MQNCFALTSFASSKLFLSDLYSLELSS